MYPNPFCAIYSSTASGQVSLAPTNVSASTTAASGVLPGPLYNSAHIDLRITNQTTSWAYVTFGDGSQATATTSNGIPFAPGSVEVLEFPSTTNSVSVILASGTGVVSFQRGIGI